jgi:hypothetical protein
VSRFRWFLVAALGTVALVVPSAVGARGAVAPALTASVGTATAPNAYAIALRDSTGAAVSHLDPGTYTITVHDYATLHNFDLGGPGVSKATDIEGTGDATWTVTFTNGRYTFQCDAHPTQMHGAFTVGTVTTPPPAKKLVGRVGPRRTISLKTAAGARVRQLKAGRYSIKVTDASTSDNFHLIAPGANKRTGVKFRGSVTWKVTLRAGSGSYRSDAHRTLRGAFRVVS